MTHRDGRSNLSWDGMQLTADALAPLRARRAFDDLGADLPDEVFERTRLLISEAVTNGVRHGSSGTSDTVGVSIDLNDERIRVEVSDHARLASPLEPIGPREGHGLGLVLMDRVADRWGAKRLSVGKAIWFELDLTG